LTLKPFFLPFCTLPVAEEGGKTSDLPPGLIFD
jgi:hypothetical protein